MRHRRGLAAGALLLTGVTVATCVYPTEHDSSVHVSVTPLKILIRGNDTSAAATAWQMRGPGDSALIPNVVFTWSSSDPKIATVDNAGHITGVKSGVVTIRAAAANFDRGALPGVDTLRVTAPLEIDSVVPASVRYGGLITAYGPGADDVLVASMKGVQFLFPYPFSTFRDSVGYGRSEFWVPPPAESDSILFIGNGVLTYSHDTTHIVKRDVFEPNDTTPHDFDLDLPGPFPTQAATLLVFNPALFFEPLKRGETFGADWYRLSQSTARPLTIILTAPSVPGTFETFIADSLAWDGTTKQYVIGSDSWTDGPSSHACHGRGFAPSEANGDSTIVAFKGVQPPGLDAIAIYGQSARYGLTVLDAYVSELPPDAHEDDNSCNAADLQGTLVAPFRDTLTIENPHDIDWIRFHYTSAGVGTTAQFRLHAFPGVHPDSLKDLDLYVTKIPQAGDTVVQIVAADTAAGSDVDLRPSLATGDYYLVVLDFAGTTTQYEVCVGTVPLLTTPFCNNGFPSPPAAAPVAHSRLRRTPRALPLVSRLRP